MTFDPCIAAHHEWVEANALVGDVEEIVARLDQIDGDDPERAHSDADEALLAFVPAEVRDAYHRVVSRCRWWA